MRQLTKQLSWRNFAQLFLAGCINAFGVTVFLAPVRLYDSGISGTAILLSQLTPLPLSAFLLLLNVPLFLFGLKKQGVVFTVYSLFAVTVYAWGSWMITDVLPIDVAMASPLAGEDLLLCALFGGVISGIGSGLTIRSGGAIDGMDVLAVTFAKGLNITVGTFVMIYNVALYILTTRIAAVGGYSNSEKTMIYFVVNRFQISRVRSMVRGLDPKAFVTITDVADVFKAND